MRNKRIILIPVNFGIDITSMSLGVVDALMSQKIKTQYFKPICEGGKHVVCPVKTCCKQTSANQQFQLKMPKLMTLARANELLSQGFQDDLLKDLVSNLKLAESDEEILVIEGLSFEPNSFYAFDLNVEIAQTFNARVILIGKQGDELSIKTAKQLLQKEAVLVAGVLWCDGKKEASSKIEPCLGCISKLVKAKATKSYIHKHVSKHINVDVLKQQLDKFKRQYVSSAVFRYELIEKAKKANKKILLPESTEPRILKAVKECTDRQLARCVLLGDKNNILKAAKDNNVELSDAVEIVQSKDIFEKYIEPMVALRKHKGMTEDQARKILQEDVNTLATMMLQEGDVDGLVSGTTHTTADTIRPAFQLIKTAPGIRLVSSVFFMCLKTGVLVFGDCAINPDPNSEELADIAIQSAETALRFGIDAKVALISYSTRGSGLGPNVDKVRKAADIARQKRPDLKIDGPLQYDAATDVGVGKKKAPDSPVAGKTTVFVFPNLDVGNALYKAVQRTNNIVCIGPMLQGLNKPVNDLSRGCSVEDVIYTIALTAVQGTS